MHILYWEHSCNWFFPVHGILLWLRMEWSGVSVSNRMLQNNNRMGGGQKNKPSTWFWTFPQQTLSGHLEQQLHTKCHQREQQPAAPWPSSWSWESLNLFYPLKWDIFTLTIKGNNLFFFCFSFSAKNSLDWSKGKHFISIIVTLLSVKGHSCNTQLAVFRVFE